MSDGYYRGSTIFRMRRAAGILRGFENIVQPLRRMTPDRPLDRLPHRQPAIGLPTNCVIIGFPHLDYSVVERVYAQFNTKLLRINARLHDSFN